MEVKVIKFERHIDIQKVSVTFSIKKIDTGYATVMASLINMEGTDSEMVKTAWDNLDDRVKYWLTTIEKDVVGSTFTVEIPTIEPEQTVEVPLSSSDQTNTE